MTSDDFINIYWGQYILLEKEFTKTLHYLALDVANESAYSQVYAKLMLVIGSEVDVVFKEYCRLIDSTFGGSSGNITKYKDSISNNKPDFVMQQVSLINYGRVLCPWIEWNTLSHAPWWWIAYNTVKHNRIGVEDIDGVRQEGFRFANQKYVVLALAGLYQIMVYCYHHIASAEGKHIVTPMPGSRLFKLSGGIWDTIEFFDEIAYYVDEGNLSWKISTIHY